ncbi:MAG: Tropinesterase [Alphaproteobacteria bacterium MarineAlpha2_Bin1]|nr:MAG: Tropinesterase [Alphaproteobacteria bacterium MarineAlpha2_Bin1]
MESIKYQENFWRNPSNLRRDYTDCRFGQIHYRIVSNKNSNKKPLVCFHLSPNSSRVYNPIISILGEKRICVAADTPGFGDSDSPNHLPKIQDYAAAMGDLIDNLDFNEIDVMGYHTGSKVALTLALQRPTQIKKIILISAPVYTEKELENQKRKMGHIGVDKILDDGSHLKKRWSGHLRWVDKDAPIIFTHREVAESLKGGENSWWGHRAAFEIHHKDLLPKIEQPILILCPNDDLLEPTLRSERLLNNGKLIRLDDCSHGMFETKSKKISKIIEKFLNSKLENHPLTKKIVTPQVEPQNRKKIQKNYMDSLYGQLHYRKAGNKASLPPLICLHMSPNSGKIYETFMKEMSKDRVVFAPDTPGFGESDPPFEEPSIEDYAKVTANFIDNLGYKEIDLIGYHTGSITCVELANYRPDLVRRIIQISCPIYTEDELEVRKNNYKRQPIEINGDHLINKWKFMLPFYGKKTPRSILVRNFTEGLRGGPFSHWGHKAAFNYDLKHSIQKIDNRILIVNPNDDLVKQTPRGINYAKNATLLQIEDYGHGFLDIITKEFASKVRDFLAKK